MSDRYLIYSYEHDAWWRPNRMGYTRNIGEAGVYDLSDAARIVAHANRYRPKDSPNEAVITEQLARAIIATHNSALRDALDELVPASERDRDENEREDVEAQMIDPALLARARALLAEGLRLFDVAPDASWLICHLCGATSYNPNDAKNGYCARCHVFFEDVERAARMEVPR
jgi:hypothetical protein